MKANKFIQTIALIFFGVILPSIILSQAYFTIQKLEPEINYIKSSLTESLEMAKSLKKDNLITSPNDYAFLSLIYTESALQKTMINKQLMKLFIIHIGMAVISVGIMFIILGINDGGVTISGSSESTKFDFRTGSTGVAVFIVGAIMASAGGLLKNEYRSGTIPKFGTESNVGNEYEETLKAFKYCSSNESKKADCFFDLFQTINEVHLE